MASSLERCERPEPEPQSSIAIRKISAPVALQHLREPSAGCNGLGKNPSVPECQIDKTQPNRLMSPCEQTMAFAVMCPSTCDMW